MSDTTTATRQERVENPALHGSIAMAPASAWPQVILGQAGVLFHDNQVACWSLDPQHSFIGASTLISAMQSDVSVQGNQFTCDVRGRRNMVDAMVLGGTVRVLGNRFNENLRPEQAKTEVERKFMVSAFTIGLLLNDTSHNQATHCIYATTRWNAAVPIAVHNTILVELLFGAICGERGKQADGSAAGKIDEKGDAALAGAGAGSQWRLYTLHKGKEKALARHIAQATMVPSGDANELQSAKMRLDKVAGRTRRLLGDSQRSSFLAKAHRAAGTAFVGRIVTDAGVGVPGYTVRLRETRSGASHMTRTDERGGFVFDVAGPPTAATDASGDIKPRTRARMHRADATMDAQQPAYRLEIEDPSGKVVYSADERHASAGEAWSYREIHLSSPRVPDNDRTRA